MERTENPLRYSGLYRPNQEKFPEEEVERSRMPDSSALYSLYHENSKRRERANPEANVSFRMFQEDPDLKRFLIHHRPTFENAEAVSLPDPTESGSDIYDVLHERRSVREFDGSAMTPQELSDILHHSAGASETRKVTVEGETHENKKRTYPSAGGLYPVELYVLVTRTDGIRPGLYYYENDEHELDALERMDESEAFETATELKHSVAPDDTDFSTVLFLTADFRRMRIKYGERGYKLALLEAGHLCQNVLSVATELGLGAYPSDGFYDDRVNDLLRLDGTERATVYSVCIGVTDDE